MTRTALADLLGKPKRNDAEGDLQRAIWSHILIRGTPDTIAYAVPNGGARAAATGARLKAQGVVPGIADLMFILADGSAAAMELKAGNNRQSPEQVAFAQRCDRVGVPYALVYDLDTALEILVGWGVIRPEAKLSF